MHILRLLIKIGIALALASSVQAAHVIFNYQSLNTSPQAIRTVTLFPVGTFTNGNNAMITRDRVRGVTDLSGSVTISNVYGGTYRGEIVGTADITTNWFFFPVTNGLILAANYTTNIPGVSIPFTLAVGDTRYLFKSGDTGSTLTNIYGRSYGPSILAMPMPFIVSASEWNPIVVAGAGTAAANGNYVLISSNLVAGLPYAVWSNSVSAANTYRLVLNNTNVVPSSIYSNLWTIENVINVNFAYDLAGPGTFYGTWEVSGLGGTPGAAPFPTVGIQVPSLISASAAAANGVLTLSPGNYDIQGYIWYPTNLTVVANGATIVANNALVGFQPIGFFKMRGGSFSNANLAVPAIGSKCLDMTTSSNYISFIGSSLFGAGDVLSGSIHSDNLTISLIGCELGTFWDVATFSGGAALGLSNVVLTAVGCKFYSVTNGLSLTSTLITSSANQTRVSGCYLEEGVGFTAGSGVLQAVANSTNEINGCVIITRNGAPKINQSAGTMIVDGSPYDPSEISGTVIFKGAAWYSATNSMTAFTLTIGRSVYTNMSNDLTFTGLTTSPAGNYEGTGTATLLSNGSDRTVVTPASWHCSDYVSSRKLTNGNQMVLTAKVIPGISTNVAIAQFK